MAFREKFLFSKLLFGLFAVSLVWTASQFIVPYTLPAGRAVGLDGTANAVDNAEVYDSFWFYPRIIYLIGDAQCHQIATRSLFLNGNQMPMDARMTSIYAFANVGLLSAMFAVPSTSVAQGIINTLPNRWRAWGRAHLGPSKFAALIVLLGILPVAVDGFYQLFQQWTHYESTNLTRVLTGIPTGWVSGVLVGVIATSIRQVDLEMAALRARAREA